MSSADLGDFFCKSASWLRTWPRKYGVAVAVVVLSMGLRYMLTAAFGSSHYFIVFYPGILIVALLAGFVPGLVTTTLSAAVAAYFLLSPRQSFVVEDANDRVLLVLFFLAGVTISWVADWARRRANRLQEFERVVEELEEMILVIGRDYRYLLANPAFERYHGLKHNEIVGRRLSEILTPCIFEESIKPRLQQAFQGQTVHFELSCPYPKLGVREMLISYLPVYGATGVDRVSAVIRDITEQRRTELALRQSEQMARRRATELETILDTIPVPVLLAHDPKCEKITANRCGQEVLQAEAEQNDSLTAPGAHTSRLSFFQNGVEIPIDELPMQKALSTGLEVHDVFTKVVLEDGTEKYELGNAAPLLDENGQVTGAVGASIDITQLIRAEQALRRSEEHFRVLVEQASDGIFIADSTGHYIDVNSAGAEMLGYTRQEVLQRSIADVVSLEDRARIPDEIAHFAGGATTRSPWTFRRKDGSEFPGEVIGKQLPDGRLQGIVRDMTEHKRAEEELRRSAERFRVALKDSPITVFNQDTEFRYTWIYNPQQFWKRDAIGKTDAEILGEESASELIEIKRHVLKSGRTARAEITLPKDGRTLAFDLTVEPLLNHDGAVVGITGAAMDIARLREIADRLQDDRDTLTREKKYLESQIRTELGFEDIIGRTPELAEVLRKTQIVAPTQSTVLILGETGTGKELLARSVHRLSPRKDHNFVKLNCAAVPSGLLESELFGHEKGAFTSAVSQKVGRIELADKGTLFLDEIGELPLELQPKLLRFLQDREFERLGGVHTLRADVRIVAATNRDLRQEVADKKFREDLFYRLNVFPLELPALRERRADIPMLIEHFVEKHSKRMNKHIEIIPVQTIELLQSCNWPGNIRELENVLERMVILSKGTVLAPPPAELEHAEDLMDGTLTEIEREHIMRVLRETNGVLSGTDGAASRLGLKRTTLQSMLKRFNIQAADYRRRSHGAYGGA